LTKKGDGDTIIEIETGFTPPDHAMDTIDYFASKNNETKLLDIVNTVQNSL